MTDEQLRSWSLLLAYFTATSTLAQEYDVKKIDAEHFADRVLKMAKAYDAKLRDPTAKT